MRRIRFTDDWSYRRREEGSAWQPVTLPHDAMFSEKRDVNNPGIHNIGYFEGHDYVYRKEFSLPDSQRSEKHILEFEGVYRDAKVYLNGETVASCPYGYTDFFAEGDFRFGEQGNTLEVHAKNGDQPNSRWYTGSGIYRPVYLWTGPAEGYIPPRGLKVRTIEVLPDEKGSPVGSAIIGLRVRVCGTSCSLRTASYEILDPEQNVILSGETPVESGEEIVEARISLSAVSFWDHRHPTLYEVRVRYGEDEAETTMGVRSLSWDRMHGMRVNGKRILLRGACIHSDNQLLGAVTDPDAEIRRIRLLKKWGYNAIRCAHNPASVYLLEACDRLGMYVCDEYTDMWYIHKTKYDYAGMCEQQYPFDLRSMVDKDHNHPSVILYSTGNEVAETGEARGIELTQKLTECLHRLDPTRPVTCGVNIFFNLLYSMGFGVYSDEKSDKEAATPQKKKAVGSEFYNQMAGVLGDSFMKHGAALHASDVKTRDAFARMDIAGYNYGILRYGKDLKKYPDRLILGSETFCKDAYRFYEFAKSHPGIIGDFVWAGMDYIGEAGIGSWEYEDYAPAGADPAGWLTAGSGRLDITGKEGGEAYYTRVAFDREKGPKIAVTPVYQTGRHTPSAWKLSGAMRSWSYRGCEGLPARVEVYARAAKVELYLNGKLRGRKKNAGDCTFRFRIPYENGRLEAVAYDARGEIIGRDLLNTAEEETILRLIPEEQSVRPDRLLYLRIRYTDAEGEWKPMVKDRVRIRVEGGSLLALGNGCPYNPEGYLKDSTKTYYGEALAVIRAGETGRVKVYAEDERGKRTAHAEVPIRS